MTSYIDKFNEYMEKITLFNQTFTNNELSNYNINYKNYLNFIKCKRCLNCKKELNQNDYLIKIPCNCYFCSQNCLQKLFENYIFESNSDKEICCLCSYNYNANDLYKLGLIFSTNNLKKEKEYVIKIFNNLLYKQCSKCGKISDNSLMQPITYVNSINIDDNINFDNNILANSDKLKHFLCLGCLDYLNRTSIAKHNSFQCLLCGINHNDIFQKK